MFYDATCKPIDISEYPFAVGIRAKHALLPNEQIEHYDRVGAW